MDSLERFLSRPTAKPYRSRKIEAGEVPQLNDKGELEFHEGDVENPKNWTKGRRWYITIAAICLVLNATFASTAPSACLEGIRAQFHVSEVAAGLVVTLFLLGYCFGPLFFAPLSEFFGRRWLLYGAFISYVLFNFLCAFAPNFGSLLVGRFLTGTFASAPLSNVPGMLADLWGPVERGNAMALFAVMTFAGPGIAPSIAGFLQLKENWRWSFYVLLWMGAGTAIIMFTIPETHAATVLTNKARRIRRLKLEGFEDVKSPQEAEGKTLVQIFKVALTRPWIILFDPISFLVAIYISVTYCLLYMLFSIYPIVFHEMRGWNDGVSELPLIGTVCGAALGGALVFIDSRKKAKQMMSGVELEPEDRLPLAQVGGVGFAVTMFWFGWTANFNSIPWIVPTLAGAFLSTSIVLIFVSYLGYLTDTYLMYAASAIAANTVARSAAGAAAPLFTNQMFRALGVGGGGSLIGGVATLLAIIPFAFARYGKQIRVKSKFAPTGKGKPDQSGKDKQKPSDEEKAEESEDTSREEESQRNIRQNSDSSSTASTSVSNEQSLEKDIEKKDQEDKKEERI